MTFVRKVVRFVLISTGVLLALFVVLIIVVPLPEETEGVGAADVAPEVEPATEPAPEPEPEPAPEPPTANTARQICQRFIERSLNDPRSAEWVDLWEWPASETEPGRWLVRATFRATNAFNALILATYECEVNYSSESWLLIRLDNVNL
jgi:hypothetical protein